MWASPQGKNQTGGRGRGRGRGRGTDDPLACQLGQDVDEPGDDSPISESVADPVGVEDHGQPQRLGGMVPELGHFALVP